MKRKTFIVSAVAATAIIAVPLVYFRSRHFGGNALMTPNVLAHICDENTIREIGTRYMAKVPSEGTNEKLSALLLRDNTGKQLKLSDDQTITALIDKKIQEDFSANRTIMLSGWILSTTEARQCALLSLTGNNN